jgi:hypothetical protein
MTDQFLLNCAIGLIGVVVSLGVWIVQMMWKSIQGLKKSNLTNCERINSFEVLVAGHYIRREDVERSIAAIFTKLDRIEDKLDRKADK